MGALLDRLSFISPIIEAFRPALVRFPDGVVSNTREATRRYLNQPFKAGVEPIATPEEGVGGTVFTAFADGSGFALTTTTREDGTVSLSLTLIATSREALGALLDVAASGFTEVDSHALSAGISR